MRIQMASETNTNAYLTRLRPRNDSQPIPAVPNNTTKKRSRNALRDVSNKNKLGQNEPKTNPLQDGVEAIPSVVVNISESEVVPRIAAGDRLPHTRTSNRIRAKINHSTVEATNVQESSYLAGFPKRGNDDLVDNRNSSMKIAATTTHGNLKKDDTSYECVHPDYRLERVSFDGQTHTLGIATHDKRNKNDVLFAVPYISDIFQNLFSNESKYHPQTYLQDQTEVNSRMRAILVDWLIEVHAKFRLSPETLYLCVNILDRYCTLVHVKRSQLQLVGVTSLLLACKYEEIHPPEVRDFVFITDRAYTRQDVLDMEQGILHELKFHLTVPTAYPFLQRYLQLVKASTLTKNCANYFLERTLQEHNFLDYRPSLTAASAVILALNNEEVINYECRRDRDLPGIPLILLEYTGFDEAEIMECAEKISLKVDEETMTASKRLLTAVKKKYREVQYGCVGHIITQVPNIPHLDRLSKKRRLSQNKPV